MPRKQDAPDWPARYAQASMSSQDARIRDFYAESFVACSTPASEVSFVAMDFETTGLDPTEHEIVSIGLIPFTVQRIFCHKAAYWLVKPDRNLTQESVVIHGIMHAELLQSPSIETVLGPLLKQLAGHVPVVHYRTIENQFLEKALMDITGEILAYPVIDTMELERRALVARQGLAGRLMRRSLGSLRLSDCRQRYSLPRYEAHHALTDALATAELFIAQLAYHYNETTAVGQLYA